MNIFIASYLRANLENVIWYSDDVTHISVAHSFQQKKEFYVTFLPIQALGSPIDDSLKDYPFVSNMQNGKGPLFYISLGYFYQLLGTTPKDFYFHGSVFNNLLSSIFLILFFIFVKKKFNLKIAFFSSLLISFIPSFAWSSARVLPDGGLLFIFCISALFFIERKKKDYLLFGVFAGLAHLTHPFGIFIGSAYCLFLLFNREFKGFLITFVSWQMILLPWFLRNYYFYKDIGWGLFLPFSAKISSIFSFLPHKEVVESNSVPIFTGNSIQILEPFRVFIGLYQTEFMQLFHMDYFIIFLILTSGFAFLTMHKISVKSKYLLLIPIIIFYVLVYYIGNPYAEIASLFIIPLILVYYFYTRNKSTFEKPIPRIYSFIIFFAFINLIAYYYTAILYHREVPESRQLLFAIFLLTPLALVGLEKILKKVELKLDKKLEIQLSLFSNGIFNNHKFLRKLITPKILSVILMSIVLLPLMIQMIYGIDSLNHIHFNYETNQIKATNSWIRNNISNQTVASDLPSETFLRTGLESSSLPTTSNQIEFEDFLYQYDIKYLVFYDLNQFNYVRHLYDSVTHYSTLGYSYSMVFSNESSFVIKTTNLIDSSDIHKPILYLHKATKLEILGKLDEANKIYSELLNYAKPLEEQGDIQDALYIYDKTSHIDKFSQDSLEAKIRLLTKLERYDDALQTYDALINIYENKEQTQSANAQTLQKTLINIFDAKAKLLVDLHRYDDANDAYLEIIRLNMFDKNAHENRALILDKLGMTSQAEQEYDFVKRLELNNSTK